MTGRIPWKFRDLTQDPIDEYDWEVNGNTFSMPYSKTITESSTAAPDGRSIIFEGRPPVQRISFGGVGLTEAHLEELIRWFNKETQVEFTDDIHDPVMVYFTSFQYSRKRSIKYPWRFEYTAEFMILDWA